MNKEICKKCRGQGISEITCSTFIGGRHLATVYFADERRSNCSVYVTANESDFFDFVIHNGCYIPTGKLEQIEILENQCPYCMEHNIFAWSQENEKINLQNRV